MSELRIQTLELPNTAAEDSERGALFREAVQLVDASNASVFGEGNQTVTPESFFTALRGTSAERTVTLVCFLGGELVATANLHMPMNESTDLIDTVLFTHPNVEGQQRAQVFEELVDACVQFANDNGRVRLFGGGAGVQEGEVTATTGFGAALPDDPESAAWLRRGASLSQVYRYSRYDLTNPEDLRTRLTKAKTRAPEYRVVTWEGETPSSYRRDMRTLHERMSTDSPMGDLAFEPELWSDERLTEFERFKMGSNRRMFAASVQHRGSGELVGYTQLVIADDPAARQHNLIVMREHRGHGLGELLKLAGIDQLQREVQHADRITTLNAEENRHMIKVNELAGFRPVTWIAVWQLKLKK